MGKTPVGICHVCKKIRWLGGKGRICKPCGYKSGKCIYCGNITKIYVRNLCYMCYEDSLVRCKLLDVEKNFFPKSDYNKYIFSLYLTYIRRYKLHYFHFRQAKKLVLILEKISILPFLSWKQIYEYSKNYNLTHKPCAKHKKGCAFLKIGYMLSELGVLPPRADDLSRQQESLINVFDKQDLPLILKWIDTLLNSKRTPSTLIEHLKIIKKFYTFIKTQYPNTSLCQVNFKIIEHYIAHINNTKPHYIKHTYTRLNMFFRWCRFKRFILVNPCTGITVSKPTTGLHICSEEQFKKLCCFIKNINSNPEHAFLLSLIVFFGLTTEDLTFATITVQNEMLNITLRRKERSAGRRFYNRDQTLKLPQTPVWFFDLQKRFYAKWLLHYNRVNRTFPHHSLILPYHNHYNRPLYTGSVCKRIYNATLAATGVKIPPRILRQTCGHLHSMHGDASILARLGWSPEFAFYYTWLPRQYYKSTPT